MMASSNYREIAKQTLWTDNPVIRQILVSAPLWRLPIWYQPPWLWASGFAGYRLFQPQFPPSQNYARVRMMAQTDYRLCILVDIVLRLLPDMTRLGTIRRSDHYQLYYYGPL